jgi:hypothetical protein
MLTFYEENFEIFFVEEKAIKFMEDLEGFKTDLVEMNFVSIQGI